MVLGSLYALVALGYTMVYGILKLLNFAHGEIYMVGRLSGLRDPQRPRRPSGAGASRSCR